MTVRCPFQKYSIFLLGFLAVLILTVPISAQEKISPPESRVTSESIEASIEKLIHDEEYQYEDASLDDPVWLTRFKEFLDKFREKLSFPAREGESNGGFIAFSYLIGILVTIGTIFIIMRVAGEKSRIKAHGSASENNSAKDAIGQWGDMESSAARELAAIGDFRSAISTLFRSALKGLGKTGWIQFRTSAGSRTYLRQLRRSAELYPLFRDFLGRFEVAYYRKDNADKEDWDFMYNNYENLAREASVRRSPSID